MLLWSKPYAHFFANMSFEGRISFDICLIYDLLLVYYQMAKMILKSGF